MRRNRSWTEQQDGFLAASQEEPAPEGEGEEEADEEEDGDEGGDEGGTDAPAETPAEGGGGAEE